VSETADCCRQEDQGVATLCKEDVEENKVYTDMIANGGSTLRTEGENNSYLNWLDKARRFLFNS
jgi:hypothetical protein